MRYAQDVHGLPIACRATDAVGTDSAVQHVLSGVNPQRCRMVSFKAPSAEELDETRTALAQEG